MTNRNKSHSTEGLSEAQQKFVDVVISRSTQAEGVRGAELSSEPRLVFPGVFLVTYVSLFEETQTVSWCAEVTPYKDGTGSFLELLAVDEDDGKTIYQVADGLEPIASPVPDGVIESFMQRHGLVE